MAIDILIRQAPKWRKVDASSNPEGISNEDLKLLTLRNELSEIGFSFNPDRYIKQLGAESLPIEDPRVRLALDQ